MGLYRNITVFNDSCFYNYLQKSYIVVCNMRFFWTFRTNFE